MDVAKRVRFSRLMLKIEGNKEMAKCLGISDVSHMKTKKERAGQDIHSGMISHDIYVP